MCSEESKDINTTNNCPEWDSKQADKNKHDNNYNWLYRLSRTSSNTVLRDLLNEENERKSTLLGKLLEIQMTQMTHWARSFSVPGYFYPVRLILPG